MELIKRQLTETQINQIINKCWEDENFKKKLIASPLQTIEGITGSILDIPEDVELRL